MVHAALPRLDDRRRLDRNPKNRIAEHIFDRRFDQRRPKPAEAAE